MNILHPEGAQVIAGPADMPDCQPLPIVRTEDAMISFWQPNAYELEALQRGGSIFLRIPGRVHPVVSLGVDEYPATLATEPHDEALDRAAKNADQWAENAVQEAFKAGARWQAARPMEITFEPLAWFNPEPHIHACRDDVTHQTFILSEHDGAVYFGSQKMEEFKTGKTLEAMKEELQAVRNSRLMSAINIKALAS